MNNIYEFDAHPISRLDFWAITAPVSAAIILLTIVMVFWKNPRVVKFTFYAKEKLRRSPKRKADLENQIPGSQGSGEGIPLQRIAPQGEEPQEEEPQGEEPQEEEPQVAEPQVTEPQVAEPRDVVHEPSPPPDGSQVWTLKSNPSIEGNLAIVPGISSRTPDIPPECSSTNAIRIRSSNCALP